MDESSSIKSRLRDRSGLKTPQRYDNVDYQDRHQNEDRELPAEAEPSDVYRGPVIQYNPNLRPAVFPTIPLDQEVDESLFVSSEVHLRNAASQHPQRATQSSQTQDVRGSNQSDASSRTVSSHTLLGSPVSEPEMFTMPSTDDRWSRELNKELNTSPFRAPSPNMLPKPAVGIGSKVWNDNMKKLEMLSKRTETDWNIAEMETSDEDEAEETKTQAQQHNPKDFAWDCLAVVHRLCIVDAVDDSYNDLNATFKVLRLTPKQKDQTIALIAERNEYVEAEEAALKLVRDKASEILRSGNQDEIDWLTKEGGYGELMEDNVYIADKYYDYMTTTRRELCLAKRYLVTCGLKPELIDHWASVDTLDLGCGVNNPSTSASTSVAEPRPAAFPTIPLGQVYQGEYLHDDNGDHPSASGSLVPGASEHTPSGLSLPSQEQQQQQIEGPMNKKTKTSGIAGRENPRGNGPPSAAMSPKPKPKRRVKKPANRRATPAGDKGKGKEKGGEGGALQQLVVHGFAIGRDNTAKGMDDGGGAFEKVEKGVEDDGDFIMG